jgi:hypothetical protein
MIAMHTQEGSTTHRSLPGYTHGMEQLQSHVLGSYRLYFVTVAMFLSLCCGSNLLVCVLSCTDLEDGKIYHKVNCSRQARASATGESLRGSSVQLASILRILREEVNE